MHADFELDSTGEVRPGTGWGGARRGAGKKPADYVKPQEVKDFETARARNELAKAQLNELDLKVKSGEYVSRAAVQQAAATSLASIAQTLRSIPDNLERRGLDAKQCELVEIVINETLDGLAEELAMLSGNPT
jgi:phage terminase Nu1 subunit (DNA packaging protein)